ncbi:hypothetical protein TAMA11512_07360 [Selenomonas sp. TAMA-11512]|uniref:hypothetical protein n=1 Tax=Selenomonas sp. TAMA-11512 TaxID=3095337 RepID=UPI00308F53C3|nr:hypothetical protein TAMA11512_07360 [Selenomonas sp. TAMA-11512]
MTYNLLMPILVALLLIILYAFIKNRKVYAFFSISIFLASCIAAYSFREPAPSPMTEEQKLFIGEQQQIFVPWYERHQQNIDQLDRNWQAYHNILESFKANAISIQTVHLRLTALEQDALAAENSIRDNIPPLALETTNYDLVTDLREKTLQYAHAQYLAILHTKNAADPAQLHTDVQSEQSRMLQEIMIKESPVGLFTASEVDQLRTRLTIPEDESKPTHPAEGET